MFRAVLSEITALICNEEPAQLARLLDYLADLKYKYNLECLRRKQKSVILFMGTVAKFLQITLLMRVSCIFRNGLTFTAGSAKWRTQG